MTSTRSAPVKVPEGESRFGYVIFIAAAAAMGGFLFGYDSAVINGAVTGIQKHFGVGSNQTGFAVAAAHTGSRRRPAARARTRCGA